jgi:hypothetical protein
MSHLNIWSSVFLNYREWYFLWLETTRNFNSKHTASLQLFMTVQKKPCWVSLSMTFNQRNLLYAQHKQVRRAMRGHHHSLRYLTFHMSRRCSPLGRVGEDSRILYKMLLSCFNFIKFTLYLSQLLSFFFFSLFISIWFILLSLQTVLPLVKLTWHGIF